RLSPPLIDDKPHHILALLLIENAAIPIVVRDGGGAPAAKASDAEEGMVAESRGVGDAEARGSPAAGEEQRGHGVLEAGAARERKVLSVTLAVATDEGKEEVGEQEVERQGDDGGYENGLFWRCPDVSRAANWGAGRKGRWRVEPPVNFTFMKPSLSPIAAESGD
ncbi:hypothetical protein GP486_008658, partial [Trichoglossum hirsutum]